MNDDPAMASDGVFELFVARALWIGRSDAASTAIDAATQALVEGVDSAPLRELAGASPDINAFELGALIDAALTSAGVPIGEFTDDDALQLAARHYATGALRGELQAREIAGWAHSRIGHEGPAWAQELVELDDRFDDFDGGWGTEPGWAHVLEQFLVASRPAMDKWNRHAR